MEENTTGRSLTTITANIPAVSVRDKSTSDLTTAIRSPGDEAYVLERTRNVLSLYFEQDMSPRDRAEMIEEFRKALGSLPRWAVAGAFDDWVKQHRRRPSPGELVTLARKRMQPFHDELAYRQKQAERQREDQEATRRATPSPEAAQEIMHRAGFTPERMAAIDKAPMARSFAEAEAGKGKRVPHWTEGCAPDDPRLEQLNKARDENPLIQAARRDAIKAARREEQEQRKSREAGE